MPLTDDDIRLLTWQARRARPHGAAQWDEPGIAAAITKVRHLSLADVMRAVANAADDREAQTPGVIANLRSKCWQDRPMRPPGGSDIEASKHCATCGEPPHDDVPDDNATDTPGHIYVSVARARGGRRPPEAAHQIATDIKSRIRPLGDRPEPTTEEHADA